MQRKTIVLFEFRNGGHREAFMQFFVKALVDLGHEVICIMPDTLPISNWIDKNVSTTNAAIHYFNITLKDKEYTSFGRFNYALSRIPFWIRQRNVLKKIEKQLQKKIDLVYFNWLDSQMGNYLPAFVIDSFFHYKWSGLYFHPVIFRMRPQYLDEKATSRDVDAVFLSKNCIAITLHDEGIMHKFQHRIDKPTILFPEIADTTPANPDHVLAKEIRQLAKGRTIVGIIGLEPYKGALSLIKVARIADPELFFFAFTGVFNPDYVNLLPEDEKKIFTDFMQRPPENCLWKTGGFKEGEDYNSVFCSFDIVHIVYNNFYSSSNRLTKAAAFERLVLASNYGCVGDDVPTYNLGEIADENNVQEQYDKLLVLRNRMLAKDYPYEQWKIYSKKHSTEILPQKFTEVINLL